MFLFYAYHNCQFEYPLFQAVAEEIKRGSDIAMSNKTCTASSSEKECVLDCSLRLLAFSSVSHHNQFDSLVCLFLLQFSFSFLIRDTN